MSSNKLGHDPPVLESRPAQVQVDPPMVVGNSAGRHAEVQVPAAVLSVGTSVQSPEVVDKFSSLHNTPRAIEDWKNLTDGGRLLLEQPPKLEPAARLDPAAMAVAAVLPVHEASRWKQLVCIPFYLLARALDLLSLLILLAFVAAIPVIQLVSLGYLLVAGARLADGRPWRQSLPGLRLAGRIGVFFMLTGLSSLPVLLTADLAYSARLLEPGSFVSAAWRIGAFLLMVAWLIHVGWAAIRGGRWWHFVWPAPLQFFSQFWRPAMWSKASDQLYDLVSGLQLPRLWWLGARATVGALSWLVIPVSMMIIGQRAQAEIAPLVGLLGAILMAWIMFYLPFFQLLFAQSGSLKSFLAIAQVRRNYAFAPWAHTLGLVVLSTLAIPLYLLRIEATPSELTWLPSLFFASLMLPSKLMLGWAIGYSNRRQAKGVKRRAWWIRAPAKIVGIATIGFYVGALYVAQLIAAQGAYVMYFQHAFLVPNPLFIGN